MADLFAKSLFECLGGQSKGQTVTYNSYITPSTGFGMLCESLTRDIEQAVSRDPASGIEKLLECGSNLLNQFCWLNWISCDAHNGSVVLSLVSAEQLDNLNTRSLERLSWDGEVCLFVCMLLLLFCLQPAYALCKHPLLLYLAHVILVDSSDVLGPNAVSLM